MSQFVVAESHELFRLGLVSALRSVDQARHHVNEVADFESLVARSQEGEPIQLALVDWNLPSMGGFAGLARFRARNPHTSLVVMGASESLEDIQNAFRLGVAGYVPRAASVGILCAAVQLVLAGGLYVPPQVLAAVLDGGSAEPVRMATHPGGVMAPDRLDHLTDRQREVMRELCLGKSNKSIARVLGISEGTVKLHLVAAFRCIGARNRTEAVLAMAQMAKHDSQLI